MERVRREAVLGPSFSRAAFEHAVDAFVRLYNVKPERALCSPDVLARYCALFERSADTAMEHSARIVHAGMPLLAAIMPTGTIAFEGEVDENRMGDW
ncbi:MAG: hypothetical protein ACREM6_11270 [Vulcanimicrobiaceae bacterium]